MTYIDIVDTLETCELLMTRFGATSRLLQLHAKMHFLLIS